MAEESHHERAFEAEVAAGGRAGRWHIRTKSDREEELTSAQSQTTEEEEETDGEALMLRGPAPSSFLHSQNKE